MTAQHIVWLALGLGSGLVSAYPWGRWNGKRVLGRARQAGIEWGLDHCGDWSPGEQLECNMSRDHPGPHGNLNDNGLITWPWKNVPRLGDSPEDPSWDVGPGHPVAGPPSLAGGPATGLDWRESMAAELAPEALQGSAALQLDEGSRRDVARPGPAAIATTGATGPGRQTPAQRRRDKHNKQRGQWAPIEPGHWYAEQLHGLADWQAEWHADVAAFDAWLPGWAESYAASLVPSWTRFAEMVA